jgi:hypothetical protein
MEKEIKPFDKLLWGFVPALILPAISVFVLFELQKGQMNSMSFEYYITYVFKYKLISKVLSVTLISNLAVFFLFLQTERYRAVRGVLTATVLYCLVILLFMFVI